MFKSDIITTGISNDSDAYGNVEERWQHDYLRTWSVKSMSGSRHVFKTGQ